MQSQFSKKFNHDPIAKTYDENIKNEDNPIRTGYSDMMKWIKEKTLLSKHIIDLWSGTGNTANQIDTYEVIYCIDISKNMLDIAQEKLKDKKNIFFKESDLLSFFDNYADNFKENKKIDTIISTYAIHHLTQEEKHILFKKVFDFLPKHGKIIFGDLMFQNRDYENKMKEKYPDLLTDFEDELYWYVEEETKKLEEIGFSIEVKQFSDLSWGIYGIKGL